MVALSSSGIAVIQITRLPKKVNQSAFTSHVEQVTEGRVLRATFALSRQQKRTKVTVHLSTKDGAREACRRLRNTPWRGTVLHVALKEEVVDSIELKVTAKDPSRTALSTMTRKQESRNALRGQSRELAVSFHRHLISNEDILDRCSDREEAGIAFQEFWRSQSRKNADNGDGDDDDSNDRMMESYVFLSLRQKKLLRSKRYGKKVIMSFASEPGEFPSKKDRQDALAAALLQAAVGEENKHGVEVSSEPTGQLPKLVPVGDTATLTFAVSSLDKSASLVEIAIRGAQKKAFAVNPPIEELPKILVNKEEVHITFTSTGAGVYRGIVRMEFDKGGLRFTIERYLTLRSGDPAMERILQPTAPYKKRAKKFEKPPKEVIEAPKGNLPGKNTFADLRHCRIPGQVAELIRSNELECTLQKPDDSIDTYEHFWKHILWASEHQAYEDIKLFDMEKARLGREGRFMVLTVPGLAEGRPSVLRGDILCVNWNGRQYRGRVHTTRLLDLLLEFDQSFHHKFNNQIDTVDIRFTFSRTTFRTSHAGCTQAPTTMGERMLVPKTSHSNTPVSRYIPGNIHWANRILNQEQQAAVEQILEGGRRPLPYVIFGPPGTGKSTTVAEAVYQLARHKEKLKILLVAPSNDAADVLVEKLASYFPPSEMRRIIAYSRSIDQVSPAVRNYVREGLLDEEKAEEISSARIVVSTVNLAARFSYFGVARGHFDVLCVDEAGHATEPEVIAVAASLMDFTSEDSKVGQMILAGDPRQLGPVITSDLCERSGLATSYMERLTATKVYGRDENNQYPKELLTKLVRNYRSHPSILKLPNEMFYDYELVCCGDVMQTHSMARWEHLPKPSFPVLFHAVNGENLQEGNSPSWFNPQEVQEVVNYVDLLVNQSRPSVSQDDIGIITPYARQAQKIRLALKSRNFQDIKVGSVETFQGQERRCIIVSTVRSQTEFLATDLKYNLGFVANEKRFNVAMTRAQSLVVVIGCPAVLASDEKNWRPFLEYCKANGSWLGQDWDEDAEKELIDRELFDDISDWEVVAHAPSRVAEEGFAFINREE